MKQAHNRELIETENHTHVAQFTPNNSAGDFLVGRKTCDTTSSGECVLHCEEERTRAYVSGDGELERPAEAALRSQVRKRWAGANLSGGRCSNDWL